MILNRLVYAGAVYRFGQLISQFAEVTGVEPGSVSGVVGQSAPLTDAELALARDGKYLEFWRSRHAAGDPVARVALIGWKDPEFTEGSALERFSAYLTWKDLSGYISDHKLDVSMEQIGAELALAHAAALLGDSRDSHGVPSFLSPTQVANYHHTVFERHGIPPYIFGGTRLIPGSDAMFDPDTYSAWWCDGCDTTQ